MNLKIKPSYLICHRLPERSFFFKGHQFPVCARCTGFYMGFSSCLFFKYFGLVPTFSFNIIIACILATPLMFDGTTQLLELRESNNTLRFITGLMFGLFMLFIQEGDVMADDGVGVLVPCICCGLPVIIFLIHNFGFQLFYGGPDIFALVLVFSIGLIFTLLGVKLLNQGRLMLTNDDGSTVLCCGIPLLGVIVFAMAMIVPSVPLMWVFIVVLVLGAIILLFS